MEKNEKSRDKVFAGESHNEEELIDPPKDKTLHRGLKARQISMIAVSLLKIRERPYLDPISARWSHRNWLDYR
jgi:hypothetical protein